MPGFGDSPPLPDGVEASAANLGAAVSDLCAELGVERPHVAGNSLGGWAALEIAKAGRAASVCAISPAGLWRDALGPRSYNLRGLGRLLKPALRPLLSSAATRSRLLATTMAHPERMSGAEATALISGWLDSSGYDDANEAMRAHVFEHPERGDGADDDRLGRPRPARLAAAARADAAAARATSSSRDAGTRRPGTTRTRSAELLLEASSVGSPPVDTPGTTAERGLTP